MNCIKKIDKNLYPWLIVSSKEERDQIPCKIRQNGLIAVVIDENYSKYQMTSTDYCNNDNWMKLTESLNADVSQMIESQTKNFVSLTKQEIVSGEKTFKDKTKFNKEIQLNDVKLFNEASSKVFLNIDDKSFNNLNTNISQGVFGIGTNIFPKFNVKKEEEKDFSINYLAFGDNLFTSFTGDKKLYENHPAHDSWVGVGFNLGGSFEDGTNVTLVGTDNMGANKTKLVESLTAIGKGNNTGVFPGRKAEDVVYSKSGYKISEKILSTVMLGHENWLGDVSESNILGSNNRPWRYVYNSIVLGNNNMNLNVVDTEEQKNMPLECDIIIGNSIYKRLKRHSETHNLLIGMDYFWGSGVSPNYDYIPLVEGNFMYGKEKFQINGKLILSDGNQKRQRLNETKGKLSLLSSLPRGVYFSDGTVTVSAGAPLSGYIEFYCETKTTEESLCTFIQRPSEVSSGDYGSIVNLEEDSGNNDTSFTLEKIFYGTKDVQKFQFNWNNGFQGVVEHFIDIVDTNEKNSFSPYLEIKNSENENLLEVRAASKELNHLTIGNKTGNFLDKGSDSCFVGNNVSTKTIKASNSCGVGNNNLTKAPLIENSTFLGNNILEKSDKQLHYSSIVGYNIGTKENSQIKWSVVNGFRTLSDIENSVNTVAIGNSAGSTLQNANNSVLIGSSSGLFKNVDRSVVIGQNYTFDDSDKNFKNVVLIGDGARTQNGLTENTVTIGNPNVTENHFFGKIFADSLRFRNTGEDLMSIIQKMQDRIQILEQGGVSK